MVPRGDHQCFQAIAESSLAIYPSDKCSRDSFNVSVFDLRRGFQLKNRFSPRDKNQSLPVCMNFQRSARILRYPAAKTPRIFLRGQHGHSGTHWQTPLPTEVDQTWLPRCEPERDSTPRTLVHCRRGRGTVGNIATSQRRLYLENS